MKTIAYGDGFHEEGNFNTACFLLPPFQGEIKPPAMRMVVDLKRTAAAPGCATNAHMVLYNS
jgi:hypothetical protein